MKKIGMKIRMAMISALFFTLVFFVNTPAQAACTNPAGVAGEEMYNSSDNVMQYCNGDDWVAMVCNNEPDIAPADCSLPWGGTILHNASSTAYQTASVSFGNTCTDETRTCNNGALTGSYTNQNCTINPAANCPLPWGGTVTHGNDVIAYQSPNSNCTASETRSCSNGALSGSYQYNSCTTVLTDGVYGWASGPNTARIGGADEDQGIPKPVVMPSGVTYFSGMDAFSNMHCGFGNDNVLYCMGYPGNGTTTFQGSHVAVGLPSGVTSYQSVSTGQQGGCAEGNNNRVYCWGLNGSSTAPTVGKFGNGTTTLRVGSPVQIPFPPGVTRFLQHDSAGYTNHYLGDDGNIYSSGAGSQGMLGNSSNTDTNTLVQVTKPSGVSSWTDIYAGSWQICAKANTGSIYCWGSNDGGDGGQLGNGNTIDQNRPVSVIMPSGVSTFTKVSLNTSQSCAIAPNEELYCWGHGIGTTPQLITRPSGVTGWADAEGGNTNQTLLTNDGRVFNFRPGGAGTFTAYPSLTNVTDISAGTFTIHAVKGGIVADTTPDSFDFTDQSNANRSSLIYSNTITISGINTSTPVSISGAGSPSFSINGGAYVTSGTINNGQTLRLRLTSNGNYSTTHTATANVGGVTDGWSVTTQAAPPPPPTNVWQTSAVMYRSTPFTPQTGPQTPGAACPTFGASSVSCAGPSAYPGQCGGSPICYYCQSWICN